MLADRQIGVGGRPGQFTQYEKNKIGNSFVPNKKEKSIVNLLTKVFCGTFSRDGEHFVTASQGYFKFDLLCMTILNIKFQFQIINYAFLMQLQHITTKLIHIQQKMLVGVY